MKKIFAVVFAMLFAASTGVYAAKHMPGEMKDGKAAKTATTKDAKDAKSTKDAKGAKDAKKTDKK